MARLIVRVYTQEQSEGHYPEPIHFTCDWRGSVFTQKRFIKVDCNHPINIELRAEEYDQCCGCVKFAYSISKRFEVEKHDIEFQWMGPFNSLTQGVTPVYHIGFDGVPEGYLKPGSKDVVSDSPDQIMRAWLFGEGYTPLEVDKIRWLKNQDLPNDDSNDYENLTGFIKEEEEKLEYKDDQPTENSNADIQPNKNETPNSGNTTTKETKTGLFFRCSCGRETKL